MPVWTDEGPRRRSASDIKQFRAGAHASDAGRYQWLSEQLKAAKRFEAAQRAARWAFEHERVACDLLGIKGRQR